ncbi:MAG: hypothetical protein V1707_02565 [bacterium]
MESIRPDLAAMKEKLSLILTTTVVLGLPTVLILLILDWWKPGFVGNTISWYWLFIGWLALAALAQATMGWKGNGKERGESRLVAVLAVLAVIIVNGTEWFGSKLGILTFLLLVLSSVILYRELRN